MKKREICLKKYLKQSICPSKYGPTGEVFILPAANKVDLSISQYKN
ncbi:MAG TPA: hypothetical protein LFV90_05935 [Rickettsia endosymbiont of Columbicola hoogstraali]|nr:hypothetical protein [Rickettsia endosymbiont of Columbicola hoogstraali]